MAILTRLRFLEEKVDAREPNGDEPNKGHGWNDRGDSGDDHVGCLGGEGIVGAHGHAVGS